MGIPKITNGNIVYDGAQIINQAIGFIPVSFALNQDGKVVITRDNGTTETLNLPMLFPMLKDLVNAIRPGSATEQVAGILPIATLEKLLQGTDNASVVTPALLENWKAQLELGGGSFEGELTNIAQLIDELAGGPPGTITPNVDTLDSVTKKGNVAEYPIKTGGYGRPYFSSVGEGEGVAVPFKVGDTYFLEMQSYLNLTLTLLPLLRRLRPADYQASFYWVATSQENPPARFRRLITLPKSAGDTWDSTKISFMGGGFESTRQARVNAWFSNRYLFKADYEVLGDNSGTVILAAYLESTGEVTIYQQFASPTDQFLQSTVWIRTYEDSTNTHPQGIVDTNFTEIITPSGEPIWSSVSTAGNRPYRHFDGAQHRFYHPVDMSLIKSEEYYLERFDPAGSTFLFPVLDPDTGKTLVATRAQYLAALGITPTAPVNGAPVLPGIPGMTINQGTYYELELPAATDPNGDGLTYSTGIVPAGMTFDPSDRKIKGTPTQTGVNSVSYTATDTGGLSDTQTFGITVAGAILSLALLDPTYNPSTGALHINPTGGDGSTIDYRVMGLRDWGLSADFTVPSWQRNGTAFTLQAKQVGRIVEQPFVTSSNQVGNQPPRAGIIPSQTATIGQTFSYSPAGVFSDPDADMLTYAASGLPPGLVINSSTGAITGTPTQTGTFSVSVIASDGKGGQAPASFTLTVTQPVSQITAIYRSVTGNQLSHRIITTGNVNPEFINVGVYNQWQALGGSGVANEWGITYGPATVGQSYTYKFRVGGQEITLPAYTFPGGNVAQTQVWPSADTVPNQSPNTEVRYGNPDPLNPMFVPTTAWITGPDGLPWLEINNSVSRLPGLAFQYASSGAQISGFPFRVPQNSGITLEIWDAAGPDPANNETRDKAQLVLYVGNPSGSISTKNL